MKKFLFIVFVVEVFFLPLMQAAAFEWFGVNQSTIKWNAVTKLSDGKNVNKDDTIKYKVYVKKMPGGAEQLVGETAKLEYTLTFSQEGRYIAGVRAVRIPKGETDEVMSAITWSDSTDTGAVPDPFGIKFFVALSEVKGLSAK